MELKLLTPPTDSPSKLPLTRGLPSESSFAVDTSALPRALPQATIDPNATTAPMDALARLGATGAKISGDALNTVLEAEARKRNASNMASAEILYSNTQANVDRRFNDLRMNETQDTFLPAYDKMFAEEFNAALDAAPNDQVKQDLLVKLGKYRVVKGSEALGVTRSKTESFHLGLLDQQTHNYVERATDQTLPPAERELARQDLIRVHQKEAGVGFIEPDKIVTHLEKSLDTIGKRNAEGAATVDPEAFYKGGWEAFRGEMPLDDLVKLRETARGMYYGRLSDEAQRVATQDKEWNEHEKERMNVEATSLEARLTGIEGTPPTDAELAEHIRRFQQVRSPEQTRYWQERRAKLIQDGPVNPVAFAARRYELYTGAADLATIQQDRLERRMSTGETDKLTEIASKLADRTQIPNYQAGKTEITQRLGLAELNWLAGAVPMFKPADQAKLRGIMADALAEYEQRLPGYKGDPVTLGQEIGKRTYETQMAPIINGMVGIDTTDTKQSQGPAKTPGEGISDMINRLKRKLGFGAP